MEQSLSNIIQELFGESQEEEKVATEIETEIPSITLINNGTLNCQNIGELFR